MIQIQRYNEILVELIAKVNQKSRVKIAGVKIAVNEAHMAKKLRDKEGIWLCSNYPDAQLSGGADSFDEQNKALLFLVEKVPSGQQSDEDELLHYAKMQQLMQLLKMELLNTPVNCSPTEVSDSMRTEWEYDIFGGFNGLSLGIHLTDYGV